MAFASLFVGSLAGLFAAGGAFVWLDAGFLAALGIYSLVGALTTLALVLLLYWRDEAAKHQDAGAPRPALAR